MSCDSLLVLVIEPIEPRTSIGFQAVSASVPGQRKYGSKIPPHSQILLKSRMEVAVVEKWLCAKYWTHRPHGSKVMTPQSSGSQSNCEVTKFVQMAVALLVFQEPSPWYWYHFEAMSLLYLPRLTKIGFSTREWGLSLLEWICRMLWELAVCNWFLYFRWCQTLKCQAQVSERNSEWQDQCEYLRALFNHGVWSCYVHHVEVAIVWWWLIMLSIMCKLCANCIKFWYGLLFDHLKLTSLILFNTLHLKVYVNTCPKALLMF